MQNKAHMQQFVEALLQEKLPTNYYYHNFSHALYVQQMVQEIGTALHCTEKELELLSAAALWHDTGFIYKYAGHEEESCGLAKQYLPGYGFTEEEIATICGIIMATKMPQSPTNKLEQIIADADLAYLGTPAAAEKSEDLFKELQSLNPSLTKAGWDKTQVEFISAHRYFTSYCQQVKEPVKQQYLKSLLG